MSTTRHSFRFSHLVYSDSDYSSSIENISLFNTIKQYSNIPTDKPDNQQTGDSLPSNLNTCVGNFPHTEMPSTSKHNISLNLSPSVGHEYNPSRYFFQIIFTELNTYRGSKIFDVSTLPSLYKRNWSVCCYIKATKCNDVCYSSI